MQNVLKDEEEWELVLTEKDFDGCSKDFVASARQAAIDRKKGPSDYVITLGRSMVEPFLSSSKRRDLRKKVFEAFSKRGELNPLKLVSSPFLIRIRIQKFSSTLSFSYFLIWLS